MSNLKDVFLCVDSDVGSYFGLRTIEKPGEEGCLGRLTVGGNYLWYLAIVSIFMELGEANRWGGGRF